MKKTIRIVAFILMLSLLSSTFISCTNDNISQKEKTVLKFYGWGEPEEKKIFNEIVDQFMVENTDIKVIYENVPSDYTGKMNAMLTANPPDVFYVPDGDFGRWVSSGVLKSIQEYIDKPEWKEKLNLEGMWENALLRYRYNGQYLGQGNLYCLPKDIGPTAIFYNKELFKKMGVSNLDPKKAMSFADLVDVAKKLTVKTTDGRVDQYGIGPIWWEGFVWSNGGEVVDAKSGKFLLTEPAALEAIQFVTDLVLKYKVSPTPATTSSMSDDQMFQTGKVGMIINGRWKVPSYRKLNFDWDVAPMPYGKTGISSGWSGSVGFAMSAKTKYPDAAFRLIAYLGGKEGQKKQAETGFNIPNYVELANTDVFLQKSKKPANAEVFIDMAKIERPGPWNVYPDNKWWDILNQNLYKIWEGKETPENLLNKLKPRIEQAIKEGNPQYFK